MSDVEKSAQAAEHGQTAHHDTTDYSDENKNEHEAIGEATFDIDGDELPDGYFRSRFFLGTMLAIGLGLTGGVAGFAFAAPILGTINADIGPSPNIDWVALVYTLTSSVTLTIIGRVTDIFGRRWVFTGGTFLGIIGSIVCATAQNVNTLIGGMTIIGISAATQLSYYYVMGELVPMKYRFLGNAYVYMWQLPSSAFAPAVSNSFIQYTKVGWRGAFYVLIGVNGVSFLCWFFFYHPPTFQMKHQNERMIKYLREFDYTGTVLYTGGLLILMMGLNWGGSLYPWKSAAVISTITIGALSLVAFGCWEALVQHKEPLVPVHLFRNRAWNSATVLSGIGASMYYAFAIVWPTMCGLMWAREDDPMYAPWLSTFVGMFIVAGEIVGGILASHIRHLKWQCLLGALLGGLFFAVTTTCSPETKVRACVLVSLGVFFLGWMESLSISLVTLTAKDQGNLGSSGGLAGSIRFFISSIASTVYTVVLRARSAVTIPAAVAPAVEKAGLPASSVASFIDGFTTGSFANVTGLTDDILAVGTKAYFEGNFNAYRTVFLVTLAFTGLACIAGIMLPNDIDKYLTNRVHVTLHQGQNEDVLAGEKREKQ
ncbi:trichothecene efflux pump [Ophiostoma piceae UAMH 11346]|uniref:Trichothecene efflux pump n=1 Tax=Ophiostoma piceae (strain UAMH 11346) TaxID=1262450 RepID=S3DBE6_OPHP1|nr:trichothecene efflux pump [Ophiostoma piceae UAMH 11346]